MDFGDEAAAAGKATIQGYINAANDMLPQVKAAYAALGKAATDALGYTTVPGSSSAYNYSNTVASQYERRIQGYASGTEDAEPGWAMVGEDSPELMFFNGGEKVLNAAQTAAVQAKAAPAVSAKLAPSNGPAMSAGGAAPSIQVTFQIGGNATQETVRDLREFGDEIVARVLDTLEEAGVDAQRGAF